MDRDKLRELANEAIDNYFEDINSIVNEIVSKIVEEHNIEDDDDIDYLKAKIMHGLVKWDE